MPKTYPGTRHGFLFVAGGGGPPIQRSWISRPLGASYPAP